MAQIPHIALAFLVLCTSAFGEITGAGKVYKLHEPIVLEVEVGIDPLPEGAQVSALWRIDEPAQYRRVQSDCVYVWAPAGKYHAMAIVYVTKEVVVDGETILGLLQPPTEFYAEFQVGGQPDNPDPPPPGPIPTDDFDNIGQRVNTWATGLADRQMAATCYQAASKSLLNDPTVTPDSVSKVLVACLTKIPAFGTYTDIRTKLNTDLESRWPMSARVLGEYFGAVAVGWNGGAL
jgi:hypothetical protein